MIKLTWSNDLHCLINSANPQNIQYVLYEKRKTAKSDTQVANVLHLCLINNLNH